MLVVLNYVPKLQAIDKTAALILELKRQNNKIFVIHLIALNAASLLGSGDFQRSLLTDTGDLIIEVDPGGADAGWKQVLAGSLAGQVGKRVALLPLGGGEQTFDRQVVDEMRRLDFRLVGYTKSIHDEAHGISTPLLSATQRAKKAITSFAASLKGRKKPRKGVHLTDFDAFMAFNDYHMRVMRDRGMPRARLFVTGYPLLYQGWIDYVRGKAERQARPRLTIFPRGQKANKVKPEAVVTNESSSRLIMDILECAEAMVPDWEIVIKPHPFQDVDALPDLETITRRATISHENPSILCAASRVAVTTYSSTALDALAFDVPCIEYFEETDFFNEKHPTGSPFPALGAQKARTRKEFEAALGAASRGELPRPDLAARLGHKTDLTIFTRA